MKKTEMIELLKTQIPGFYSQEQVIKMITDLEEEKTQTFTEEIFDKVMTEIGEKVESKLYNYSTEDIVDFNSAEFGFRHGNEVVLDDIGVSYSTISEIVSDVVGQVIRKKFNMDEGHQ